MIMHKIAYENFYENLLVYFSEHELTAQERAKHKLRSSKLWETARRVNGVTTPVILSVFGKITNDARIFYRLLTNYSSSKAVDEFQEINDKLLIAAFEYIGCKLTKNVEEETDFDDAVRVQILFQLYLTTYFPTFMMKNKQYIVFDFDKNELLKKTISENAETSNLHVSSQGIQDNSDSGGMGYDIVKLVNDFYRFISSDKLLKAWELLAPVYKAKLYKDSYENFQIGYHYNISVNDVHVWNIKMDQDLASCNVYYVDTLRTFTTDNLNSLKNLKLDKLDEFIARVNGIVDDASITPLQNFNKIEIAKLFEPGASEYIWYKCGMKPEVIQELLPDEQNLSLPRLYNIAAVKLEDAWLIKSIVPITTRLIR